MLLHVEGSVSNSNAGPMSLRCPSCRQLGTFETIGADVQFANRTSNVGFEPKLVAGDMPVRLPPPPPVQVGHRVCPNLRCRAHLFVVVSAGRVDISYPPERIDFDSTNVPAVIVESLEEAITCYASRCFIAAAIMIRKTLELLCSEHGADGKSLAAKVKALGSKVVLPAELLNGLDDVRLLGNDAAHFESKDFIKVSQDEIDVAIELTKEVLKALYQYSALLARMRGLKKQL